MATETTKLLQALELDKNGDWDGAHKIVQGIDGKLAANIHAYLHRKQGDNFNADYWYRRAGISMPDLAPDSEWQELFDKLQSIA